MHRLVGVQAESVADAAVDDCGVLLDHVLLGFEEPIGRLGGGVGKREHLEEMAVEGDQVFADKLVSREDVIVEMEVEERADPALAVEGEAVSVADDDQEKVEEKLRIRESLPEAVAQEPVVDEGEAALDPAYSIGDERRFISHDRPREGWLLMGG